MSKFIYKVCCRLHSQGGEHYALRDDDHNKWGNAELEDKEYVVRKEIHNKKIKTDNETANEVFTRLIKEFGNCDKSEDDIYSGDVIICRNAILNDKKYTFGGTLYEFMNKIQGDAGCKILIDVKPQMTDNGFFKTGGCACEGEERYDDGGEVYQVHHLRGYKYPKEPVACQVKKFDEGGLNTAETTNNSNNSNNSTQPFNPILYELQNIISGTGKIRYGDTIQSFASNIRAGKNAGAFSSGTGLIKDKEAEIILKQDLPIPYKPQPNFYITEGTEHFVYLDSEGKNVYKYNSGYFYDSWEEYLYSLLLHNYFFPDTSYQLVGFSLINSKLYSVVRQPFVGITDTPVDLTRVEKFLSDNGFIKTDGENYFNKELGITIEDLHEQNVIIYKNQLFFIDTIIKIKDWNKFHIKFEGGGQNTSGQRMSNSELQKYIDTITFDELYNGAIIPDEFYESYQNFINTGAYPYHSDVVKYFIKELNLKGDTETEKEKIKTVIYWISQSLEKRKAEEHIKKMLSDGWKILGQDELAQLYESKQIIITSPEIKGVSEFSVVKGSDDSYYLQNSRQKKSAYSPFMPNPLTRRFFKKKGQPETGQETSGQETLHIEKLNEFILHPDLDASIYIEKIDPKRDKIEYEHGWQYKAKISYPESLGEQGNYEEGFVYKTYPSKEEQETDIKDTLENERQNIIEGGKKAWGLEEIYSGRDENILKAINKVLDKKSPKEFIKGDRIVHLPKTLLSKYTDWQRERVVGATVVEKKELAGVPNYRVKIDNKRKGYEYEWWGVDEVSDEALWRPKKEINKSKELSEPKSILTQETDLKGNKKEAWMKTNKEYIDDARITDTYPERDAMWERNQSGNHLKEIETALETKYQKIPYKETFGELSPMTKAISEDRMTANDAKIIIKSAGLKVPNDIETEAEPENFPPTPWLIKEKLNLFTDLLTQKDNIKEKAGVAIFYKNKILLTHPTGAGWKGTYSIPKGVTMQGETAIETAERELREETSIQLPERVVSQFKESQADIILKYREGGQVVYPEIINGFYSPIEKNLLETKAENKSSTAWLQQLGKGDEMIYTGLKEFLENKKPNEQVKKSEILEYLKNNRIEIVEIVKKDVNNPDFQNWDYLEKTNPTKFRQYQIEGDKSSYREVLITMPMSDFRNYLKKYKETYPTTTATDAEIKTYYEQGIKLPETGKFKSPHFAENNILAHIRSNIRTDAEGKRVLFIEELQSDWSSKGRKEGFKPIDSDKKLNIFRDEMKKKYGNDWYNQRTDAEVEKDNKLLKDAMLNVPQAPYVTDTNAWVKLSLKVSIRHAIDEGTSHMSWTTGEQQNDRYDLSKQVKAIHWSESGKNKYVTLEGLKGISDQNLEIGVDKESGRVVVMDLGSPKEWQDKHLSDVVGKDVAGKILNQEKGKLEGEGLKAGGSGMIGFYGSPKEGKLGIVGQVAESLFGKGSVKTTEIKTGELKSSVDKAIKYSDGKYDVYNDKNNKVGTFDSVQDAIKEAQKYHKDKSTSIQHSIDITPEIIDKVKIGLPLFREGGQVSQHIKAVTELNIPAIEKEIEANKLLLTETSKILAYKIEEKKKEREELKEKGYNNFKINERVSSMVREEEKLEREIRNYKTNISKNEEIILLYNRVKNEDKTKAEIDKLIEFIEKNHHLEYDDRKKIGYHEKEQKLRLNFNSFLWSKNLKTGALINVYFLKDLYKKYGLEFLKQNEASEIEKLENEYNDYRKKRADELFKQWKTDNPGKILDTPKQDEYNAMVNKESDAKIDEMAEKIGLFIPGSKSDSEKFLKEHILVVGQPKLQEKLHADIQRSLDAEKKYKADEFETKLESFVDMLKEGSPKFRYQIKFTKEMVSDFIQQREQTKNGNGEILNDLIFKYKLKGKPDDLKKEFAIAFVQGELPSKLFNKTNLIDADWMAGEMELKIRPIEPNIKVLKTPTLTEVSLSLKDIVYPAGDSYPQMQGVYHDAKNKVLVATDAHVLVKIPDNRIKKTEVRKVDNSDVFITIFDGKKQQPRFPNYDAVIDKDMPIKFKINIQEWLNITNGVARANKFFGIVYGASGTPRIVIKIIIGEQEFFFNSDFINRVLTVFSKHGLTAADVELNTPNRAMQIKSGEIFGLMMPVQPQAEYPYYLLHRI